MSEADTFAVSKKKKIKWFCLHKSVKLFLCPRTTPHEGKTPSILVLRTRLHAPAALSLYPQNRRLHRTCEPVKTECRMKR